MNKLIAIILVLTPALYAVAGEVDIPNQFSAGTRAVAAEVNANFDAVEVAVDDNAARIAALEAGSATAGVTVRVAGTAVGRLVSVIPGNIPVLSANINGGTTLVNDGRLLVNAPLMQLVSPAGYFFRVATSPMDTARLGEGELDDGLLFFDQADCAGNMYIPVEGPSGRFSTFTPNTGDLQPLKHWYVRQGVVFQSPDPADANIAYMLRRGAAVVTTPLFSFRLWFDGQGAAICINMSDLPDFDPSNPLHFEHSAVPIEVWDPAETGVAGRLGGELTIGL